MKPAATRRTRLLLASATWTVVGASLLVAGLVWCGRTEPAWRGVLIVTAVVAGLLKVVLVLRRAAGRVARRIEAQDDDRCIGGFFSWRTWIFVALMSVGGRLLRLSGLPTAAIGFIYVAVGSALLVASCWLWHGWLGHQPRPPEGTGGEPRPRVER